LEFFLWAQVTVLRGDPVAVGYWLARNLPVGPAARQRLLEAATPTHRLRAILAHLRAGAGERLLCRDCQHEVSHYNDSSAALLGLGRFVKLGLRPVNQPSQYWAPELPRNTNSGSQVQSPTTGVTPLFVVRQALCCRSMPC
jgi:hypothetical protein